MAKIKKETRKLIKETISKFEKLNEHSLVEFIELAVKFIEHDEQHKFLHHMHNIVETLEERKNIHPLIIQLAEHPIVKILTGLREHNYIFTNEEFKKLPLDLQEKIKSLPIMNHPSKGCDDNCESCQENCTNKVNFH